MKPDILMPDYLKWLPVSDAAKEQLAALGTEEPLDLLGMIRAARPEFERLIGVDPLTRVVEALETETSSEELAALKTPLPRVSLGARLDPAPAPRIIPSFSVLVREQDRVVAAAKAARRAGAPSEHLAALERQLLALKTCPEPIESPHLSPVDWLLPYVKDAPYRAAPERADELRQVVHDHHIRITFDPDPSRTADVNLDTGEIRFGLPFAERLWALSRAYLDLVRLWQEHGPGAMLVMPESSRRLLEWEFLAEKSGTAEPFPYGMPVPAPDEPAGSDGYAATEWFLVGAAWVLLHEIGHLACGHRRNDPPIRWLSREYEADDWASHWMLDRWSESAEGDQVFDKRALAGTIVLGHFTAFESHGSKPSVTHPNPAKRLLRFLDNFVPGAGTKLDAKELPWVAAMLIVLCHLQAAGQQFPPKIEFAHPRDALIWAVDHLSSEK